jgi:hypothetical protein
VQKVHQCLFKNCSINIQGGLQQYMGCQEQCWYVCSARSKVQRPVSSLGSRQRSEHVHRTARFIQGFLDQWAVEVAGLQYA